MNCTKGDLAYIVVPPGYQRTLADKFVNVGVEGPTDHPGYSKTPTRPGEWMCRFHVPWVYENGTVIRQCVLLDSWLRPVRGTPEDTAIADSKPQTLKA